MIQQISPVKFNSSQTRMYLTDFTVQNKKIHLHSDKFRSKVSSPKLIHTIIIPPVQTELKKAEIPEPNAIKQLFVKRQIKYLKETSKIHKQTPSIIKLDAFKRPKNSKPHVNSSKFSKVIQRAYSISTNQKKHRASSNGALYRTYNRNSITIPVKYRKLMASLDKFF